MTVASNPTWDCVTGRIPPTEHGTGPDSSMRLPAWALKAALLSDLWVLNSADRAARASFQRQSEHTEGLLTAAGESCNGLLFVYCAHPCCGPKARHDEDTWESPINCSPASCPHLSSLSPELGAIFTCTGGRPEVNFPAPFLYFWNFLSGLYVLITQFLQPVVRMFLLKVPLIFPHSPILSPSLWMMKVKCESLEEEVASPSLCQVFCFCGASQCQEGIST